jgi:aminoglycoside/choline kinase family phosphotransferase
MTREELIRFARDSLGLGERVETELVSLEGRGSSRTYYRFRWCAGDSAILIHYDTERIENAYFADIALYLAENRIPVPPIIRHDADSCLILMKDLGDSDLWHYRNEPWEVRRRLYDETLRIVHRLHSIRQARFPSARVRLMEPFGPELYRWEREYFQNNFVDNLCALKLEPAVADRLEAELAGLAERLSSGEQNLIHRDLQSQNVMIYEDGPVLIDFQGMRFGTRFYDLGSILCDPYVGFSASERMELLSFYYDLEDRELEWDGFLSAFWEASAQRLIQALGAYGFLGITKGLKSYLVHVPAGIHNLRMAAENAASLPTLLEVCTRIESRLSTCDWLPAGQPAELPARPEAFNLKHTIDKVRQ